MLLWIFRYRSSKLLFQCAHLRVMLLYEVLLLKSLPMVVDTEQSMSVHLLIIEALGCKCLFTMGCYRGVRDLQTLQRQHPRSDSNV